jgi:hypothetical protein
VILEVSLRFDDQFTGWRASARSSEDVEVMSVLGVSATDALETLGDKLRREARRREEFERTGRERGQG